MMNPYPRDLLACLDLTLTQIRDTNLQQQVQIILHTYQESFSILPGATGQWNMLKNLFCQSQEVINTFELKIKCLLFSHFYYYVLYPKRKIRLQTKHNMKVTNGTLVLLKFPSTIHFFQICQQFSWVKFNQKFS